MSTNAIELEAGRLSSAATEKAAARTEALAHMPQLDALRAIAIVGVMACHFFDNPVTGEGAQGVTLFFVLSGFLITGILIKCRDYVERDGQSRLFTLRQFYIRRFLRIFPLYYLVLAVLWLLDNPDVRAGFGWHLAYLTNVRITIFAARHQYPAWSIGHFWSLAVEEQFYLVWPWVVLVVSRRNLVRTVVLLVCAGPAFRLIGLAMRAHINVLDRLPFFWLDSLGIGALLAVAADPAFGLTKRVARVRPFALALGVIFVALGIHWGMNGRHFTLRGATYYLGYSLVFGWMVSRASIGFAGPAGKVMSWKPILWIGTISYGIYVYHFILRSYWMMLPMPAIHPLLRALLLGAASVGVSAASYYIYERPINRLRRFFPYRARPQASRPARGASAATALKESPQLVR